MWQMVEEKHRERSNKHTPPWLAELRKNAAQKFQSLGYPTTAIEDWKLSNVSEIAKTDFAHPAAGISTEARKLAAEASFGDDALAELVFINGHFAAELSNLQKLPAGISIQPLSHANEENLKIAHRHLGRQADSSLNGFVALNTSAIDDAALIHIARAAAPEKCVHLVFISTTAESPTACHPRVLVVVDDLAQLTLVESFVGGSGVHLTNSVTEMIVGNDAKIDHSRIQTGGETAFSISTFAASLGRAARLISHAATLGGKFTRNDFNVTMAGDGADATLNGLVILGANQHCDNHTLLDHAAPNCPSHELYKHVLASRRVSKSAGQRVSKSARVGWTQLYPRSGRI